MSFCALLMYIYNNIFIYYIIFLYIHANGKAFVSHCVCILSIWFDYFVGNSRTLYVFRGRYTGAQPMAVIHWLQGNFKKFIPLT